MSRHPWMLLVLLLGALLTLVSCAAQPQAVPGQASADPGATTSTPAAPPGTSFTAAEQAFLVAIANEPGMSWGGTDESKLRVGHAVCLEVPTHSREQVIEQFTSEPNPWELGASTTIVDLAKAHLCPSMAWAASPAATASPAAATPTSVSDGTYQVGVDIEPGRYKTSGPDQSSVIPNCYWQRAKDDSGEFGAIIANQNLQGPGSVTVKDGEFVTFNGGCTWTKS